jgi:uncharacterized protein YjbJ (UPF0337 family)
MYWEYIQEHWDQFRDAVKERWADLTDDDLNKVAGRRAWLVSMLLERYGIAHEEAESEIDEFFALQLGHAV